jgi:hypothetical protein
MLFQGMCQPLGTVFSVPLFLIRKKGLLPHGLTKVCLLFVVLKPLFGERKEKKNRKMEERAEKFSPNGGGISNCPQPCGGLETLE